MLFPVPSPSLFPPVFSVSSVRGSSSACSVSPVGRAPPFFSLFFPKTRQKHIFMQYTIHENFQNQMVQPFCRQREDNRRRTARTRRPARSGPTRCRPRRRRVQNAPRPARGRKIAANEVCDGYRVIVFFRSEERTFYEYCFPKSKKANISRKELKSFKETAKEYLSMPPDQLREKIEKGKFIEL